jgi:hypothetical protein
VQPDAAAYLGHFVVWHPSIRPAGFEVVHVIGNFRNIAAVFVLYCRAGTALIAGLDLLQITLMMKWLITQP